MKKIFIYFLLLSSIIVKSQPYPKICIIGNSTVASYLGQNSISYYLNNNICCWITDLSVPGNTIDQQRAYWDALSLPHKRSFSYVFVEIGLNDLISSDPLLDALGRYQRLIDSIYVNKKTSCKIIGCTMTPCKQRLIDIYGVVNGALSYAKWQAINEAIKGNSNPILHIDRVVSEHTTTLNDGNGNLSATYDMGDHIHETNAARDTIANYWIAKIY